ncbi:MAG: class I SAM-dependent methyltransferase [Alphaproteobacteria bacterium]|nr:class I SAM-dependent methyltransferase [Alphaproteobacteria bacterium]
MNWKLKAALYNVFDIMPFGDSLYYWSQKHVTRSVPRQLSPESPYFKDIETHLAVFKESHLALEDARYFEFGAGWDLFHNIIFSALGMGEQHIVDIKSLVRADLVNAVIAYLQDHPLREFCKKDLPFVRQRTLRDDLAAYYSIYYRAPIDAQATPYHAGSMDFIATTHTLEHIPSNVLANILKECQRISHEKTKVSMIVDYADHFSYSDKSLDAYHFLKYSPKAWRIYNPSNHYQNRLRHSDYIKLFEDAGFSLESVKTVPENIKDDALKGLEVHPHFAHYAPADVLIHQAHFVLNLS